jgi:hypothetical protein
VYFVCAARFGIFTVQKPAAGVQPLFRLPSASIPFQSIGQSSLGGWSKPMPLWCMQRAPIVPVSVPPVCTTCAERLKVPLRVCVVQLGSA